MKAKRGSGTSQKPASKNKRVSGEGFGASPAPSKPKSEKQKHDSAEVLENARMEEASGAPGDASPHRAMVDGPVSATMENPVEEDTLMAPERPIVELPQLTREGIAKLRFDRRQSLDSLIECFEDARSGDQFAAVVVANRDLVTERLLYRFTSAILQVENRKTDVETRREEGANMRALRTDLIAHCWSNDYPLKVEIQNAEARLLGVLQGSNIKKDVARNCGTTTLEVDAFWIVVFAAVAAWEERGRENPELVNVDMQKALTAAAEACRTLEQVTTRLSPSLKAVQKILGSSDPEVQKEVVADLDDDTITEMGSFTEQIRLFPSAAYGALVVRMGSILAYILADKYGIPAGGLEPFRFELPEVERSSRLVTFSKKSRQVKPSR